MVLRATFGVSRSVVPTQASARARCPIREKYELATSRYVTVDGVRMHYSVEGSGPTLVLMHGVAASLHTWDGWVQALAPHYRIVRVDLPGCGLSEPLRAPEHYSPEYTLGFFERMRERLGLKRFHLAGNSLGGFFSWYYAVHHPQRVNKLVLLSPIAYPQAVPATFELLGLWGIGEIARYVSPRFAVAHGVRMVYGDPRAVTKQVVQRYHELVCRGRNRQALVHTVRRIKQFARDPLLSSHVRRLRVPTLLMWGARDRLVPPALIHAWRKDVRDLEFKLYPEAGHVPMEELPDETARDAHTFLQRAA